VLYGLWKGGGVAGGPKFFFIGYHFLILLRNFLKDMCMVINGP